MIDPDKMADEAERFLDEKKERISMIYDEIERLEHDLVLLEIGAKSYTSIRAKIKSLEAEQVNLLEEVQSKTISNV